MPRTKMFSNTQANSSVPSFTKLLFKALQNFHHLHQLQDSSFVLTSCWYDFIDESHVTPELKGLLQSKSKASPHELQSALSSHLHSILQTTRSATLKIMPSYNMQKCQQKAIMWAEVRYTSLPDIVLHHFTSWCSHITEDYNAQFTPLNVQGHQDILSNFYISPTPITFQGVPFLSVEHACYLRTQIATSPNA